ncbi:unnamed protein product [Lathyrus sativus]|nr:unnamed protein product [Lathyrus sativus]
MAKKNKSKKKKNKKNVVDAPSVKPIPSSPPPHVSPPPPHVSPPPHVPPKKTIADQRLYNEMKGEAFAVASSAFEKHDANERIAEEIRTVFNSRYGPTWHCIVGTSFASSVACDDADHFYLRFSPKDIILFKCDIVDRRMRSVSSTASIT